MALEKVTGDYLLFLDADDYLSQDYFKNVDSYLGKNKNIDILRIQANLVDEEFNLIGKTDGHEFKNLSGEDAFKIFVTEKMFDMPCVYIYQTDFWKKHDFRFVVGKIHEDFELIPKTILLANCVSSVKMYLYNYVQVSNSIVHNVSIESRKKRVYDQLSHYDSMCSFINSSDVSASTRKIFMSFISNSVIDKAQELEGNDLKEYIKKLKERKVQKNLLDNSVLRFLKKLLVSLNIKLYIKFFVKR